MDNHTLTTGDIAKYCQVNFRTVIRWIERGLLQAHKLPGRGDNRVKMADFLAFLAENDMPLPEELKHKSRRILIVEDDPTVAQILQKAMEQEGYETRIALSGFHAGVELTGFSPALMTLDLDIPGLSGLDVLNYVRSTPLLKSIKVLVVSGLSQEWLQQAMQAGADGIMQKPVRAEYLKQKVKQLLES